MTLPRSIRVRLTLWYSLVLAVGLTLFAVSVWGLLRYSLRQDVEQTTAERFRSILQFLDAEAAAPDFADEWVEYARAIPSGTLVEIRDSSGRRIAAYPDPLPDLFGRPLSATRRTLTWNFRPYRVHAGPATARGRNYQVYVAESLELAERHAARLLWVGAAAAPLILLLAGIGGYWLSRRALAPVAGLTRQAESLSIENLSLRLGVEPTGDELQTLAETWNRMLGRLEASVTRLSQFTADASHELRTPLALIRTTAELALRRERSAEAYRTALQTVQHEAERTTQLISDLLSLARADAERAALPLTAMDLAALVQEVGQQYAEIARLRELRLILPSRRDPVLVKGNTAALRRLLVILLDNAFKYTPPGGSVMLSLERGASSVRLSVVDTGIGIAPDVLPHIFERFFRADPSRDRKTGGYGLGLSIAQWIAASHQTQISVESTVGSGAAFRLSLLSASAGAGSRVSPAPASELKPQTELQPPGGQ